MPKYKILNSLRDHNNKYSIYWKNREELYKDLYKNTGIKSELMQLFNKEKSIFDKSEGSYEIYDQMKMDNETKIFKNKKLSPIGFYKKDINK